MDHEGDALLSQQETEALLDAMRAGAVPDGGGAMGVAAAADGVELGDPERVLRRVQAVVDRRIPSLPLPLRRAFMRHTESGVTVTEMPSEIQPWSVVLGALEDGMAVVRVLTRGGGEGLLTCSAALVSFVVERRMGAPLPEPRAGEESGGAASGLEAGSGLSWVDRRVLRPFVVDMVAELATVFHRGRGWLRFGGFVDHPGQLPGLDRYEPVLRIPVRFAPSGMAHEEMALSLSAAAVLELEPPGVPARRPAAHVRKGMERTSPMRATLLEAEVEVGVILGEMQSSVQEVLSWCQGDVLRLDAVAGRPLRVLAEGVGLLLGEPTVVAGNLAVRVVESIDPTNDGGHIASQPRRGEVEDERIAAAQ